MNLSKSPLSGSISGSPTWVIVNGWGCAGALWQDFISRLPGDAVVWDLVDESVDDWESWVTQAIDRLPDSSVLVGWSLGGMLATQIAARALGRVKALITLACNPCFVANQEWPDAMAAEVFEQYCEDFATDPETTWSRFCGLQAQGDSRRKEVLRALKSVSSESMDWESWAKALRWLQQIDNRAVLANLPCSSLHLFGELDALVPSAAAEPLARLRGVEVHVLPNLGHALHVSAPELLVERLSSWVQYLGGVSKAKIARSFGAAVHTYDGSAHLQRQIAQRLVAIAPEYGDRDAVLDLGCGTGFVAQGLRQRLFAPAMILADIALPMATYAHSKLPDSFAVAADAEALPFADESLDGVVSSLALQWCTDLRRVGAEVQRCLRSGGSFVFSTLGPDTLRELKYAWSQVDNFVHVNAFKSIEAIHAELIASGLEVETILHEPVIFRYPQLMPLLRELKAIGAHNMNPGQKPGLGQRSLMQQMEQAYYSLADEQGLLPVTYDIVLVVAKKP